MYTNMEFGHALDDDIILDYDLDSLETPRDVLKCSSSDFENWFR